MNRRTMPLCALLSALCLAAWAGPQLEVRPSPLDFGIMKQGEKLRKSFTLRNAGDAALVITQVRANCAECVVDKFEEKTLAPGEEAGLPVSFDASVPPGKQSPYLIFHSNDAREPLKRVFLAVEVAPKDAVPRIETEPATLDAGIVPLGGSVELKVAIRNTGKATLRLTDVIPSPGAAIVEQPKADVAPGAETVLRLKLTPREGGVIQTQLMLVTNDSQHRVVTVPLRGYAATRAQIETAVLRLKDKPESPSEERKP